MIMNILKMILLELTEINRGLQTIASSLEQNETTSHWKLKEGTCDINSEIVGPSPDNKTYTHIAFADNKRGKGFSLEQGFHKYVGVYSSDSKISPTDHQFYSWRKIKSSHGF